MEPQEEANNIKSKLSQVLNELKNHLPFTVVSSIVAMILVGIMTAVVFAMKEAVIAQGAQKLFHIFHPVHILFSGAATSAMFWKHEKKMLKAIVVGLMGAILICGISDVIMPFCSGYILGRTFEFHMCIIEHPLIIAPFVVMGIFVGITAMDKVHKATFFSHAGHVFVSSLASMLYLISFGLVDWFSYIGYVFIIIIASVIIPCCTSDIIFPLLFTTNGKIGKCCGE